MYPLPGHLSLSYVLAQALNLHFGVCLVAGLFPDVFDKTLKYALHIYPYGRVIMHSLPGVLVTSLVVLLLKGKSWGLSWFVGHLFHPFADYFGDLFTPGAPFIPWYFPFRNYTWPKGTFYFSLNLFLLELIIMIVALSLLYRNRKRFSK